MLANGCPRHACVARDGTEAYRGAVESTCCACSDGWAGCGDGAEEGRMRAVGDCGWGGR